MASLRVSSKTWEASARNPLTDLAFGVIVQVHSFVCFQAVKMEASPPIVSPIGVSKEFVSPLYHLP